MATELARGYRACARTTRRFARNFYFAFLSLPRAQRYAVYALYTFCREADWIADSVTAAPPVVANEDSSAVLPSGTVDGGSGDLAARRAGLEALRDRLACAARGTPTTRQDLALADAIARFGVSERDLRDVLTGVELDLTPARIATYKELQTYCYYVASAVGLATLPVLTNGVPPTAEMRDAAADLGLGMQYVNILRDVGEDLALGRLYLPAEALAAHHVTESRWTNPDASVGLRSVLEAHAERALDLLDRGRRLLPDLPRRSRACPWLLSEIYRRTLERIVDAGYPVLERRVSLPTAEKLWLLFSSRWRSL